MASVIHKLTGKNPEISLKFSGKSLDKEGEHITVEDVYVEPAVKDTFLLYASEEPVVGKVIIDIPRDLKHRGVEIELVGVLVQTCDKEEKVEFLRQVINSAPAGYLQKHNEFDFSFDIHKSYESMRGLNATISYYVRAIIRRGGIASDTIKQQEIWVHSVNMKTVAKYKSPSLTPWTRRTEYGPDSFTLEVGVADQLCIEFTYLKKTFHLHELLLGQVVFKHVAIPLLFGEVSIVKREYLSSPRSFNEYETETLQKYEIMDGTPIEGEVVPIRLYFRSIPRLTPTYNNVHDRVTVRYFINLVLVTEQKKRYFKQQEITLYRKPGQNTSTGVDYVEPPAGGGGDDVKRRTKRSASGRVRASSRRHADNRAESEPAPAAAPAPVHDSADHSPYTSPGGSPTADGPTATQVADHTEGDAAPRRIRAAGGAPAVAAQARPSSSSSSDSSSDGE